MIENNQEPIKLWAMDDNAIVNTKQLAAYLSVSTSTIERWRRETNKGPKFQAEGKVTYIVADIKEWLAKRKLGK